MRFKACPRCNGDLYLDSDYYGYFLGCIQCGHTLDKSQEALFMRLEVSRLRERLRASVGISEAVAGTKVA
jgi:DNA-directed RNA polymerase subunit M/transcription elongation factor TFIIS